MNRIGKVDPAVEKVLKMSLDDYIKQTDLYVSPMLKQQQLGKTNFKRNFDKEEEEEDDIVTIVIEDDDDLSLTVNNESPKSNQSLIVPVTGGTCNLRERVTGNNADQLQLPVSKFQQQRVIHPNNSAVPPPDMAPRNPFEVHTLPKGPNNMNEPINPNYDHNGKNWQKANRFNNNGRQCNRINNNRNYIKRNRVQKNYNNKSNQNRNNIHCVQRYNPAVLSKSLMIKRSANGRQIVSPLSMEKPVQMQSFQNMNPVSFQALLGNIALDPKLVADNDACLFAATMKNLKSGFFSMLASQILDDCTKVHKPIYDMQIQKEIHALQDKPLNGTGPGVWDLHVSPASTGVTMNHRFS